jgi:hypothetical protein
MRTWTLWGGLLLVVGLPGCGKLAEKLAEKAAKEAQQQAATPENKDPAAAEVDKDGQLADKLSHYISCLNGASRNVFDSRNYYTQFMKDEKVGYTGKESHAYGPQEIHQADSCIKDLDEAKKKQPPLADVEAAAQAYRASLEKVTAEVKVANAYYTQGDYKDDKFAKAKQMHPGLMASFDAFKATNETFETKVVALNEEVGKRQLERIAKDPERGLEFRARTLINTAKVLVKSAEAKTLAELDQAKLDASLEAFSKALTDLDDYSTKNPAETDKVSGFSSLSGDAKYLLKAAKELSRRKRDNKDFTKESGSPAHIEGHPAQVIDKFNSLVNTSNRMDYDRLYQAQAEAKQAKAAP